MRHAHQTGRLVISMMPPNEYAQYIRIRKAVIDELQRVEETKVKLQQALVDLERWREDLRRRGIE